MQLNKLKDTLTFRFETKLMLSVCARVHTACSLHIYSGLAPNIPQSSQLFVYLNSKTMILPPCQSIQLLNMRVSHLTCGTLKLYIR